MTAKIIPLFHDDETDELERLWLDFLDKRERCLVVNGSISLTVEAGKAFGELMQALGEAHERSRNSLITRVDG